MKKILIIILLVLMFTLTIKGIVFADPSDIGGSPLKGASVPISTELK